jgi:hypothetical protein
MRVEGVSVCRMRNANGSGDCPVRPLVGRNRGIWPELEDWRYHKPQSPSFGVALNVSLKQSAEQIPSSSKTTHAPVLIAQLPSSNSLYSRAPSLNHTFGRQSDGDCGLWQCQARSSGQISGVAPNQRPNRTVAAEDTATRRFAFLVITSGGSHYPANTGPS